MNSESVCVVRCNRGLGRFLYAAAPRENVGWVEAHSAETHHSGDCAVIHQSLIVVISSVARDLALPATYKNKISPLRVEMTIETQFLQSDGFRQRSSHPTLDLLSVSKALQKSPVAKGRFRGILAGMIPRPVLIHAD